MVILFVDLKIAFDSVNSEVLIKTMRGKRGERRFGGEV